MPEPGRTLILCVEDDADEMHRRLEDIRKFYGARMTNLAGMQLVDLVGEDSILSALVRGQIEPTPMYHALDEYLTEWAPTSCRRYRNAGRSPSSSFVHIRRKWKLLFDFGAAASNASSFSI